MATRREQPGWPPRGTRNRGAGARVSPGLRWSTLGAGEGGDPETLGVGGGGRQKPAVPSQGSGRAAQQDAELSISVCSTPTGPHGQSCALRHPRPWQGQVGARLSPLPGCKEAPVPSWQVGSAGRPGGQSGAHPRPAAVRAPALCPQQGDDRQGPVGRAHLHPPG